MKAVKKGVVAPIACILSSHQKFVTVAVLTCWPVSLGCEALFVLALRMIAVQDTYIK